MQLVIALFKSDFFNPVTESNLLFIKSYIFSNTLGTAINVVGLTLPNYHPKLPLSASSLQKNVLDPVRKGKIISRFVPIVWFNGNYDKCLALLPKNKFCISSPHILILHSIIPSIWVAKVTTVLSCDSIAPFGFPVVPLV